MSVFVTIAVSARRPVMDTTESEWSVSRMSMGLLAEGPIAQFLRVFYVTSPAEPQLSKPYQLYARSFLPYKVSNRQVGFMVESSH